MAVKPMTKAQVIAGVADAAGITKKESAAALEALAALAVKETKKRGNARGFTIPGIGKLVLVARKARMGRNPATGEQIKIPAKKVVKFRVAKACKDAVEG